MKFEIPFYKQDNNLDCGIASLRMVLTYLEKEFTIEEIKNAAGIIEGKGISTIKLAIATSKLGFRTKFISKSLYFNEANLDLDFYKKYGDSFLEESKKLIEDAKNLGIELEEKSIEIKDLISFVGKSCVVVLLNWNVIKGIAQKGYQGHFVPVTGYTADSILIHNPGPLNPEAFMEIGFNLFDKARKSQGTDEDILIVYKK